MSPAYKCNISSNVQLIRRFAGLLAKCAEGRGAK